MKKLIFLVCLLLSLTGVSAQVQKPTALTISSAPSDGKWADNTQWYLIRSVISDDNHRAAFLSYASYNSTNGFYLTDETIPTTDKGLWCIVGNSTDGYSFYNKEAGADKVLGFSSTDGNITANLYDANTTESNVTRKFGYTKSTIKEYPFAFCVNVLGKTDSWWNNYAPYNKVADARLALWTNNESDASQSGNAFFFIPVNDISEASAATKKIISWNDVYAEKTDTTGYYTYKMFAKLDGSGSVKKACEESYTTFENEATQANAEALAKAAIEALDGKVFHFVNGNSSALYTKDGYAYASIENSEYGDNTTALWSFKANDDGTFSLYNPQTKKYLGTLVEGGTNSTAMVADESQADKFTIRTALDGDTYWTLQNANKKFVNGEKSDYGYRINVYSNGNGAKWYITEATTLDVPMTEVNGTRYASVYLPVSVASVDNATAWIGTLNNANNALNMTKTTGVPAENGFVLVSEDNSFTKATLHLGKYEGTVENNSLTGNLEAVTFSNDRSNYLVFGVNSNTVGFYTPSSSVATIPANKAYIDATKLGGNAIAMQFGSETTGISQAATSATNAAAPVFDLSGRRVANPAKGGIYIQNGKKFVK